MLYLCKTGRSFAHRFVAVPFRHKGSTTTSSSDDGFFASVWLVAVQQHVVVACFYACLKVRTFLSFLVLFRRERATVL